MTWLVNTTLVRTLPRALSLARRIHERTGVFVGVSEVKKYGMTTQAQVRKAFWEAHPSFDHQARAAGIRSKGQNVQCATVRCAFVDYVDALARNGDISEALAARVTL